MPVHEGIGPLVLRRRSAQERWEGDDGNARAKIVAEHVEFQPLGGAAAGTNSAAEQRAGRQLAS